MNSQSKTVVGLLLAATFAVDLVVANWLAELGPLSRIAYVYEALITAQLAVVTIWAVLGFGPAPAKWIAVAAVVGISGLATARLEELTRVESVGIYASFVILLALTLWTLKQTYFWQRLSGMPVENLWQFSLTHLLIVMTAVALLIGAMRHSFVFTVIDLWKSYTLLTIGDVLLATSTIIAWRWACSAPARFPFWLPRFGVVSVIAFAVGIAETMLALSGTLGQTFATDLGRAKFDLVAYAYVSAFVIFIYLELTPIVHRHQPATSVPPAAKA